jgi:hypothetical protein
MAGVVAAEQPIIDATRSGMCETLVVVVYASGFADFNGWNSCRSTPDDFTSGLRRVSKTELKKLDAALSKADFDSLPDRIEPDPNVLVVDEDDFSIGVRHNGVVKRVSAFGLDRALNKGAAERFRTLWEAVFQFGPEKAK